MKRVASFSGVFAIAAAASVGCGQRDSYWDTPVGAASAYGLSNAVVLVDDGAHRAVTLLPQAGQGLATRAFPIGHGVTSAAASPDGARLFVLSAGDVPRRSPTDELPSLTMLDASTFAPQITRFPMTEPLATLAVDPVGRYVAAYAGTKDAASFVANPNEIVLFDLDAPPGPANPVARTLRSFGGTPQRLTFTPVLQLPGGARRLLLVETDQDVSILDLDHAFDATPRPEITVRLTSGGTAKQVTPAGLVVDDGDPTNPDDARVAIRSSNDSNVITLELGPSKAGAPNDFEPSINLTDVGGVATDVAFVHTDAGLRVAALVPGAASAVLVDPDTSLTTRVSLPAAYDHLSLVTNVVSQGTGGGQSPAGVTDVALLWSSSTAGSAGVAFWSLGVTVGQPYRSVEVVGVTQSVQTVHGVPAPNDRLEVLDSGGGSGFYVLDLLARTAAPIETSTSASLTIARDGLRMWAFEPGGEQLAAIDLATLHPVPLTTDPPIADVFDVARADGGRSLVALHQEGGVGATIFDALAPDSAKSRRYSAILVGGQ